MNLQGAPFRLVHKSTARARSLPGTTLSYRTRESTPNAISKPWNSQRLCGIFSMSRWIVYVRMNELHTKENLAPYLASRRGDKLSPIEVNLALQALGSLLLGKS
jgi:hypothetical protein